MKSSNFICTIGPSNNTVERIQRMIYKGMAVARLNLSHGNHEDHLEMIKQIRLAAGKVQAQTHFYCPLAIAVDLRGCEIRTGLIEQHLEKSGKIVAVGELIKLNESLQFADRSAPDMIYVDQLIAGFSRKGFKVFINDGSVDLEIEDIFGDIVTCRVTKSGIINSNSSLFIPEIIKFLNLPNVTDKDKADIQFAALHDIDFIFISHVKCGKAVEDVKNIINESGVDMKVFAKLQSRLSIENIEEIALKSDGIIFAPSIDIEPLSVPFIQRYVVQQCHKMQKQCFITINSEMNSSEIYHATNWFLNAGDGFILTREASAGKIKPLESMLILMESKPKAFKSDDDRPFIDSCAGIITESLASACVRSSITTMAAAIIIVTESSEIVELVHQHRPVCEVIVVMENQKSCRQLNILDRVTPLHFAALSKVNFGVNFAKIRGIVKCGDTIIILKYHEKLVQVHYIPYER